MNSRDWLIGVQIQYWRVDEPADVRSADVLTGPPASPCRIYVHDLPEQRRRRRQAAGTQQLGALDDLRPFSQYTAGVLVLNQGNQGHLSATIKFQTSEGGTVPP